MAHNLLITRQGGWIHLDEKLPAQPVSAKVSFQEVTMVAASQAPFPALGTQNAIVDDLVLTLPDRQHPWRTIQPATTTGTVGNLLAPRRRFLLDRGGRALYVRVSEYDTDGAGDVTNLRIDEGINFSVKDGDTLSGVRCSYYVDLTGIEFIGTVKVDWEVTMPDGKVRIFSYTYDVMRQELGQPATWADVLRVRPDADNELSQVPDKEVIVEQAWEEIARDLYNMGIRHNLVVQDGSTVLRDAVVLQTILNLTMHQNLTIPQSYIGQGEDYSMHLERKISKALGQFFPPIDTNQDGTLTSSDNLGPRRQVWFRGRRRR